MSAKYIPLALNLTLEDKSFRAMLGFTLARLRGTFFIIGLAIRFLVMCKICPTSDEWARAITPPFGAVDKDEHGNPNA